MAMMVGAMTIHGITPGPQIMTSARSVLGNDCLHVDRKPDAVVINLPFIGMWVRLLKVPYRLMFPAIVMFCCIGIYSVQNSAVEILKRGGEVMSRTGRLSDQLLNNFDGGDYAGKLDYKFSTASNDYVVFLWSQPLGGKPNQVTAWVYGDGAGHFLNIWVKDSAGETWQFSLARLNRLAGSR